jgi:hypothetical protein
MVRGILYPNAAAFRAGDRTSQRMSLLAYRQPSETNLAHVRIHGRHRLPDGCIVASLDFLLPAACYDQRDVVRLFAMTEIPYSGHDCFEQ